MSKESVFIDRMIIVFGHPKVDGDPVRYLEEYAKAISAFSGATLAKAGDVLIKSAKFFPRPAEVITACREILDMQSDGRPSEGEVRDMYMRPLVDDGKAALEYLIANPSTLINMALRDGWGRSLKDLARGVIRMFREKHGRRPTQHEMMEFRMSADDVKYYAKNGQQLSEVDLNHVLSERQRLGIWSARDHKMAAAGDAS